VLGSASLVSSVVVFIGLCGGEDGRKRRKREEREREVD
jgi:hypothetical protein